MDHSKSKKHEGIAVYLANASNLSKKIRIGTNLSSCWVMNLWQSAYDRDLIHQAISFIQLATRCVQAVNLIPTQRFNCHGSEGEQAMISAQALFARAMCWREFRLYCLVWEGLEIAATNFILHAHKGKVCVCVSASELSLGSQWCGSHSRLISQHKLRLPVYLLLELCKELGRRLYNGGWTW